MARAVRKTPAEAGGDAQGVMRLGEQRDISGVHHPFRASQPVLAKSGAGCMLLCPSRL